MYNILLLHVKYSYNFLAAMNKYEYSHNMLYKNSNASVGILQFVNFVCVFIFRIKDYPFCTVGLFSDKESKEILKIYQIKDKWMVRGNRMVIRSVRMFVKICQGGNFDSWET